MVRLLVYCALFVIAEIFLTGFTSEIKTSCSTTNPVNKLLFTGYNHRGVIFVKGKEQFRYNVRYLSQNQQTMVITDCYDLSGKQIAYERAVYKVNPLQFVESKTEDYRTGRLENVVLQNNQYIVRFRKNRQSEIKERVVDFEPDVIPGPLLMPFIQTRWSILTRGEKTTTTLVLPDQSITVGFIIRVQNEEQINGVTCLVVKVSPSSFILRHFADPIYLVFEKAPPHRLMQYRGILASIKTESGDNIDAEVRLTYDE